MLCFPFPSAEEDSGNANNEELCKNPGVAFSAFSNAVLSRPFQSNAKDGLVGYARWLNVIKRLTDCKYFLVSSSCMACAWVVAEIFSLAERSWMPTEAVSYTHLTLPTKA